MTFNEEIKALIDASVDQPTMVQIANVEQCVSKIYSHVLCGYQQSRECVQYAIGQLNRINKPAVVKMIFMAMEAIDKNAGKFSHSPSDYMSYINGKVDENYVLQLLDKVGPEIGGEQIISEYKPEIAQTFTLADRKKIVGFCVDAVEDFGLLTNWDDKVINSQTILVSVMYSICKKDGILVLFFDWYYNILDRLNTSGQYQLARDFAENLLIIGHKEGMIAESYFGASRTYTGSNNVLAGLLYLNIALHELNNSKAICQRLAYDIIWQMLKILRGVGFDDQALVDKLLGYYDGLGMDEYKNLAVYHTAFSIIIKKDVERTAIRMEDFLCDKRDSFYKNIEHSAAPWYSLIKAVFQLGAKGEYPVLKSIEAILKAILIQNGNENLIRQFDEKEDKANLLIEELAKLETTRSSDDIGNDSRKAIFLAKIVVEQAFKEQKPENFILAMRPKSDFSFAMNESSQESIYRKVEVIAPKAEDCKLPYGDVDRLAWLLQTEKSDCVMWIGCGNKSLYRMTLLGNMYSFSELKELKDIDPRKLQKETISKFKFCRTGRDSGGTIYDKDNLELQQEADDIHKQLKNCQISIPNIANRLFFIKDMELSPIPHQLLLDERTDQFIGETWPSANVISTEFLIKSNFNDPLPQEYSKSYWSPAGKEGTFFGIKEHLNKLFDEYNFDVDVNDEPAKPLHSDLNIICVHGNDNITDTEWFYAGHAPIVNSNKIVGPGKVLVLFVCHSGSMSYQHYDNSIHTIVKRYLKMGYSSVIAPMWSLNIDIIPIWLPVFMRVIDKEGYVVDAVYQANMEVKKHFITPTAWACLHLFGNPYMKIAEKPILYVEEDTDSSNQ